MNNIRAFPGDKLSPEALLKLAENWGLKDMLILGWDKNEKLIWGGTNGDKAEILYLLESVKASLKL